MPPSSAQAEQALDSFVMPSSSDVLSQAETQYGVPQLQTNVNNLRTLTGNLTNSIAAVDPSVTGRTAGTLTTEAQRGAIVDREQAPITAQLGTANTALGQASDDYNTADSNAKDAATATESDNQNKYNALLQTYNIANAREAAQAQAQASAAQQAEAEREFNTSEADTNANNAANRSASSSATTPADTKAAVTQHVTQQLAGNTGKDGYVSNQTFAAALNDFQAAGGTVRAFWQQYGRYANPKYEASYAGWNQR